MVNVLENARIDRTVLELRVLPNLIVGRCRCSCHCGHAIDATARNLRLSVQYKVPLLVFAMPSLAYKPHSPFQVDMYSERMLLAMKQ